MNGKIRNLLWEIADRERAFTSYCSKSEWAVAHAAGGSKGREEGRERGYYYLHRNLNQALFFHGFG